MFVLPSRYWVNIVLLFNVRACVELEWLQAMRTYLLSVWKSKKGGKKRRKRIAPIRRNFHFLHLTWAFRSMKIPEICIVKWLFVKHISNLSHALCMKPTRFFFCFFIIFFFFALVCARGLAKTNCIFHSTGTVLRQKNYVRSGGNETRRWKLARLSWISSKTKTSFWTISQSGNDFAIADCCFCWKLHIGKA